ncbi:2-phospho-L-lactate guanylyltransferase [Novosphingobium sp.]|uniref:2-phospho-L-lactate guanylyltransferase n=1 Tax=Novosphingobium sp. TaxID=1874826 RepID=UPI0025CD8D9A|nr:2-phospho-L-lactate guanylyltransferase [Novosphingobium sp.]
MTHWHAIVPFRAGAKTRLAERLDAPSRAALAEAMAAHVLETLGRCPSIGSLTLLAPVRPAFASEGTGLIVDKGHGLNAELAAALARARHVLIIHADLPLAAPDDIAVLIDAAAGAGAAIAPDHARTGTNALAFIDANGLLPAFGPDSFALHRALLPDAAVVERPGLALDIDTPEDLDRAIAAGLLLPAIADQM